MKRARQAMRPGRKSSRCTRTEFIRAKAELFAAARASPSANSSSVFLRLLGARRKAGSGSQAGELEAQCATTVAKPR